MVASYRGRDTFVATRSVPVNIPTPLLCPCGRFAMVVCLVEFPLNAYFALAIECHAFYIFLGLILWIVIVIVMVATAAIAQSAVDTPVIARAA